ncbi:MAG: ribonuclease E inhibitor RraB [Pseudomonadota bacterium]
MISKDELQEMFDAIAENPDWDLSSEMLWGYFFTDADKSALERVAPILENMGYFVNAIYLSDKESEDDPDLWWLHIEKVEIHTVDSLHETNQVFYEFARKYGLDSYDGMDVGRLALSD